MAVTDLEHLRRIVSDIAPLEFERRGLLCFTMRDGSRLSFGCGDSGRLNMIVVQYAPDVPPIVAERIPVRVEDVVEWVPGYQRRGDESDDEFRARIKREPPAPEMVAQLKRTTQETTGERDE